MYSAPRRRISGRSTARSWGEASLASTQGHGCGLVKATYFSSMGEYVENGWAPIGSVAPLSWRSLGGLVSALASSIISRFLVWDKSSVGWKMASISPSDTSCIFLVR